MHALFVIYALLLNHAVNMKLQICLLRYFEMGACNFLPHVNVCGHVHVFYILITVLSVKFMNVFIGKKLISVPNN